MGVLLLPQRGSDALISLSRKGGASRVALVESRGAPEYRTVGCPDLKLLVWTSRLDQNDHLIIFNQNTRSLHLEK